MEFGYLLQNLFQVYVCMCMSVHAFVYACADVHARVCEYVSTCVYAYVHAFARACMCVCRDSARHCEIVS